MERDWRGEWRRGDFIRRSDTWCNSQSVTVQWRVWTFPLSWCHAGNRKKLYGPLGLPHSSPPNATLSHLRVLLVVGCDIHLSCIPWAILVNSRIVAVLICAIFLLRSVSLVFGKVSRTCYLRQMLPLLSLAALARTKSSVSSITASEIQLLFQALLNYRGLRTAKNLANAS